MAVVNSSARLYLFQVGYDIVCAWPVPDILAYVTPFDIPIRSDDEDGWCGDLIPKEIVDSVLLHYFRMGVG